MPHRLRAARSRLGDWAFWLWAVVGVGYGFAISAIGLFTVPLSLIATIFLLTRRRTRASAYGVLVGIGVPLLVVAFLNREGPGTVCHSIDGGRGTQCEDLYDPRKWLAIGLLFVAAGVAGQLLAARSRVSRA
jgi:hypothetical protein